MTETSLLCGIYPYSYIFKKNNINISEVNLFGMLELSTFDCYFVNNGKKSNGLNEKCEAFSIVGIKSFNEKDFNNISRIQFFKSNIFDKLFVYNEISKYIKSGKYVITFLDVYYLTYHPLFNSHHGQAEVIVHNIEIDKVYISDHHMPTFPPSSYEGWISKDIFIDAILLGKSNEQNINVGIISYNFEEDKTINELKLTDCIENNFNYIYNLYGSNGNNAKNKIINLVDKLRAFDNKDIKKQLFKSGYAHITGRAGMVISRKVMFELLNSIGYTENIFNNISDMWKIIAASFFRLSLDFSEARCYEMCKKINSVIEIEYVEIDKWLKKLK